jgi:putative ABC transport system permease protein
VEDLLNDKATAIPGWTLRREYRSTFRAELTETESLVQGQFTGRVAEGAPVIPISIEEGLARDMRLKLGDEVEFDVQGVSLLTRVGSVRKVDWQRMQPNFFIVFPEGVLEAAPKFFVVALRAATPADSARLQQAVVREYPNISAIDLALLLQTFDAIFSRVALVVQFMALFTVATGVIVLVGAVLTGRYQRIRETVLLRTLGATRRQLMQIQLVEYSILGILAAVVGCLLAVAANALLAQFVLKTSTSVSVGTLALAVCAVTAVTLLTGLLSSRGVTDHPPLEVLRQET